MNGTDATGEPGATGGSAIEGAGAGAEAIEGAGAGAEAIEEAAFLVRAPHRVEVLAELAAGPRTRPALEASTGVSRVTLGRSLAAMESRNWIARRDGAYRLRPLGELVLDGVTGFLGATATSRHLRDVVELLPTTGTGFELGWLADATVLVATRHDSGAVIRRYLELLAGASRLLVLKDTVDLAAVRAISDRIAAGALDADVVYSDGAVEATRAIPEARELMCRDIDHGKGAYRAAGRLAHHLAIVDDVVLLFLLDDSGVRGVVESEDPRVRAWALATFEDARAAADRLDRTAFRPVE